jgi:hypothetical protein
LSPELIARIPGAAEFADWFGHFPRFHDATVEDLAMRLDGRGHLRIRGFRMTPEVDEKGYFVLDKHCIVIFSFEGATNLEMDIEDEAPKILYSLEIKEYEGGFEIELQGCVGIDALLRVKSLRMEFEATT